MRMPHIPANPMMLSVGSLIMAFRLLSRLPSYLRIPLSIAECRKILQGRLEQREQDFLTLVHRVVFSNHLSPYLSLFQMAGCEYGDLEHLVRSEGLEGALRTLFRKGVYLTVDEYKGRRPVVRGSHSLSVTPSLLRNPLSLPQFWASTSGSRGTSTRIPIDLECIRDHAVNMYLALDARGGVAWRNAVWEMPGIGPLLWFSACGGPAAEWFSKIDPATQGLFSRYRWNARFIAWTAKISGISMPNPKYVPINAPLPIAQWMEKICKGGEVPHLWTSPSSATKVCLAAEEAGLDLGGARFTITGEPVTKARLDVIRRVRAEAMPDYGSADSGGSVSYGCLTPEAPDDVHVFRDLNAIIQVDAHPFPAGSLLLTSIRPTIPFFFLNVSMGDQAIVSYRRCGCPLEGLGWSMHLHTIRSYEKLTAGGMTFADTDIISVLEETLPKRFGGDRPTISLWKK